MKKDKPTKPDLKKWRNLIIIAVVFLTIGLVLLLKNKTSTNLPANPTVQANTNASESTIAPSSGFSFDGTAEEQVDYYLNQGQPVFVFFHSNDCQSCIDMMGVVDEVFPEFREVLPIVDVNVYDPVNQNLLRRAEVRSIPTQIFLGADGEGRASVGLMSPDQLREQLSLLAGATQ